MKLADKRRVIEVLLCCSDELSPDITGMAADACGYMSEALKIAVDAEWMCACRDVGIEAGHHIASTEAGYRLIESSPVLRREWFGVR